ncbi:iron-sulfur cluster assembly scaffold protein [Qipengyuania marisflavi]|uniref:Iron-sulfur cluster assembly scaffold protein n=1 Tax=Qipengyuania marisflavi TaxID=2486356 RepID=A0A5S3P9A6_9SPHN|nr:iron-sulfur cluster assembly scaffold protein [Qipengyuania marisflavi]TMM49903.1 iron-sulfur cluster assembly scaffold protein [Qipengyuania marisflavi]
MTPPRRAVLYSPELLQLAVELAAYPLDQSAALQGAARSRSCGSEIALSVSLRPDGALANVGMRVTACAVGQGAAAIFAAAAKGANVSSLAENLDQISAWLKADGPVPHWPRIAMLAPAREYPGRHDAILLPWRAALDALSNTGGGR